jgi:uncharacterized OB-fold protein
VTGEHVGLPVRPWNGPTPVPEPETEAYWNGLREREVRILRCGNCANWVHYPVAMCGRCHSFDLVATPVAGTGTVYSFTVVHREFVPGVLPPYVVAVIELDEQQDVHLNTNLVNVRTDELAIGMRVRPVFFDVDDKTTLLYHEPEQAVG